VTKQKSEGQPNELAKWLGPCIVDEKHKDSAIILHTDGWWSYGCFHNDCSEVNHKSFMAWAEEENGEKYPYPGGRPETYDTTWLKEFEGSDVLEESLAQAETVGTERKLFACTDLGNTERLLHRYGHLFRFCPEKGWHCWDGKRWVHDSERKLKRAVARMVRLIKEEVDLVPADQEDAGVEILKWAKASEGIGHFNAASSMAEGLGKVVGINAFDQDQWLFNCANGTLDLLSNEFREHRQEDLITNISPVLYDPKAECPLWLEFLETVLAGDQELIAFVQRSAGYGLTGSTAAHCLFMLYGSGRNGKTTFLEVLQYISGTYATSTNMEIFLVKNNEGIPNDLAALNKARFVTSVETEDGRRLAEAKVKQITGGDTISARFLHKEFFSFLPQFKIWIGTNHRPVIRGTDEGIWRRIRLIPFEVYIPDGKVDEKLVSKLKSEASGILNWMLAGLEEYKLGGLMEPKAVIAATDDYRKSEDWLARFLEAETTPATSPEHRTQARDLYNRYKTWADDAKEFKQPERKFNEAMEAKDVEFSKVHNKKLYHLLLGPSSAMRWATTAVEQDKQIADTEIL
jgi:putative DNA primase/helicase